MKNPRLTEKQTKEKNRSLERLQVLSLFKI